MEDPETKFEDESEENRKGRCEVSKASSATSTDSFSIENILSVKYDRARPFIYRMSPPPPPPDSDGSLYTAADRSFHRGLFAGSGGVTSSNLLGGGSSVITSASA